MSRSSLHCGCRWCYILWTARQRIETDTTPPSPPWHTFHPPDKVWGDTIHCNYLPTVCRPQQQSKPDAFSCPPTLDRCRSCLLSACSTIRTGGVRSWSRTSPTCCSILRSALRWTRTRSTFWRSRLPSLAAPPSATRSSSTWWVPSCLSFCSLTPRVCHGPLCVGASSTCSVSGGTPCNLLPFELTLSTRNVYVSDYSLLWILLFAFNCFLLLLLLLLLLSQETKK